MLIAEPPDAFIGDKDRIVHQQVDHVRCGEQDGCQHEQRDVGDSGIEGALANSAERRAQIGVAVGTAEATRLVHSTSRDQPIASRTRFKIFLFGNSAPNLARGASADTCARKGWLRGGALRQHIAL